MFITLSYTHTYKKREKDSVKHAMLFFFSSLIFMGARRMYMRTMKPSVTS